MKLMQQMKADKKDSEKNAFNWKVVGTERTSIVRWEQLKAEPPKKYRSHLHDTTHILLK